MNGNGPTAAKRPRVDSAARPATPAASTSTPTAPYTPSSTAKSYASNAASNMPIPTTTTPPAWTTAAQNPITLDPALASIPATPSPTATGVPTMPNPTSAFSRFLPQQQYPPGLPPTSPALSYPTANAHPSPTASGTVTPTPTAYSQYQYQPQHSQYTSAGFVRTIPPSFSHTPYHNSPLQYTPAAASASFLPSTPAAAAAPAAPNPLDSSDPSELNDVLGSAGVDVRAEQDALARARDFYAGQSATASTRGDRSRKQAFIDQHILAPTVRSIANNHNCPKVSDDALSYLALALRERLLSVVNSSIHARNHRFSSSVTRPPGIYADGQTPMWAHAVKRDVRKQLSAIEKVEREEEARIRRERHERMENPGASSSTTAAGGASNGASGDGASGSGGGDDSATGKKRKRAKEMGPGVTAKNMSEETRKKLVDDAASRAFGGSSKKYAWMTATPIPGAAAGAGASTATASNPSPTAGAGGGAVPKPTAGAQAGPLAYPRPTAGVGVSGGGGGGGGWMRAQPPAALRNRAADDADPDGSRTLTLLDVEFAVEREKGHGGGRGSARGW